MKSCMYHILELYFLSLIILMFSGESAQALDWEQIGTIPDKNVLDFYFTPDGTVLAQTQNIENEILKPSGVWAEYALERLTDDITWDQVYSIQSDHAMRVKVLSSGTIVTGGVNSGSELIARSLDNGLSWHEIENNPRVFFLHTIESTPDDTIFLGGYLDNFISTDIGLTWHPIDLPHQGMKYIPLDNNIILACVYSGHHPDPPNYLYRTDDRGETWTEMLTFPPTPPFSFYSVVSPAGRVYLALAGDDESQAYRSDDTGLTWEQIDAELPNGITGMALVNYSTVFISIENGGLYRTTDAGLHWDHVTAALPSQTTGPPLITQDGSVYIAVDGNGIFQSNDSGVSWESVAGEEMTSITALDCSDDGVLYASVDNGNIYRADTKPVVVNEDTIPRSYLTVNPASPNPFNPSTTLSYSLAGDSHVTLAVYNLAGQKVATLVDSAMPAGTHQAIFDGSGFASGMYFYRFESGNVMRNGKMLLVK